MFNSVASGKFYADYKMTWKSILDFIYIFSVVIILFDIIEGLIVDTFASLRSE
jgi:hypothetical protein